MHQSFEFIEDAHVPDTQRFAYKLTDASEDAADRLIRAMRDGKVLLEGDVFVDVPSYKVSHRQPYPFDMDAFKESHAAMVAGETDVEPFDFDTYNSKLPGKR